MGDLKTSGLKWWAGTRVIVATVALAVVAYLALRGSPRVSDVAWIPGELGHWADRHGALRNLPAFGLLALFGTMAWGLRKGCGLAAVFAVGLEFAQKWMPHRRFDPADIYWSLLGVAIVAVGVSAVRGGARWVARRRLAARE